MECIMVFIVSLGMDLAGHFFNPSTLLPILTLLHCYNNMMNIHVKSRHTWKCYFSVSKMHQKVIQGIYNMYKVTR